MIGRPFPERTGHRFGRSHPRGGPDSQRHIVIHRETVRIFAAPILRPVPRRVILCRTTHAPRLGGGRWQRRVRLVSEIFHAGRASARERGQNQSDSELHLNPPPYTILPVSLAVSYHALLRRHA